MLRASSIVPSWGPKDEQAAPEFTKEKREHAT